jgi:hypothetical protein
VSIGGNEMPFAPDEAGVLRPIPLYSYLKFAVMCSGHPEQPTALRFEAFGEMDDLVRLPASKQAASAISGRYSSAAAASEITIETEADGARMYARGRYGAVTYELECLAEGVWCTRPSHPGFLGGMLSFERGSAGFRYSNLLTRDLPFKRVD